MAPAYADREASKILFGACANTVSSWIYWGTHGVLLTSDPSDAILGSDDYPKGFRRPNCSLAGDAGFIDPQNPCCGSRHGEGIARSIQSQSENVFLADHELCIRRSGVLRASAGSARWGVSENNREARFCILTSNGGEQLMEKPASGSAWCEGRD